MPQDVEFSLPWPLRVSSHLVDAKRRNLAWMRGYGFLDRQSEADYLAWRLAEVSAYFYPDATLDGLCLATDLMGWYFTPFDDQFDGPVGRDPRAVAQTCDLLTGVLRGAQPSDPAMAAAFADIWRRWTDGMSPIWCARTTYNWLDYFAVYVTEAHLRAGQIPAGGDREHLWRRRRSISSGPLNDLIERACGFEAPPLAWHCQTLHEMRKVAADIVSISNDVASVEKEVKVGDVNNNLLLLLERRGLTPAEAIREVQRRTAVLVGRFLELEQRARELASAFPDQERIAIERHVLGLQDFMRGNDHWERTSHRYAVPTRAEQGVEVGGSAI